ncbi:MAG: TolC family protein [Chlorobiaceae bacterium]|nr:TolC family protein [Chlorobiaceae bacterium]
MKIYKVLIGCFVLGALAAPLQAKTGDTTMRLSLSDAITMARQNNYSVKAARSRVDQAEAKVVQTRQSYLPKVTLSETLVVTNDPGAALVFKLQQNSIMASDFDPALLNNADLINDFNTSLQVTQPVYNADAAIGRSMALTAKKAQEQMAVRTEESVAFQVTKVYYGLILARKNIEAVEESIKTMQAHSKDAAKSYRVGLLTKSDKLSTDVRLAELQEQKLLLHDEIKNATDMLIVMLKLDPDVTIVPTGDLVVDRVLPAGAEQNIPENRADIKALETYRQVAAYQEEMAEVSKRPRLNAFMQTNLHSNNIFGGGSSWALGMTMQWNIYDGMASAGRIQETKAQAREAMYNYEAAKSNSLAEVSRSFRSLKTAKARIAVARKSLEEAKVSLDYIGTQFKTGMAMTFELLMREQAYTYAKMRLNQATYDYCVSRSELEYYRGS